MKIAVYSLLGALAVWSSPVWAQSNETPASDLVPRNIKAIGYQVGGGSATVDLVPSGDVSASGEAKVQAKPAITTVEAEVRGLRPPTQIGAEFLTYVMWAVSPDGRADNLGELIPDNSGKAKLKATTQLQSFSLFVTAEPYSVVRHPLYLAEELALLSCLLRFFSPVTLALFLVHGALQIARMIFEENLLRSAFPDYDEYARSTSRLIPHVW